MLPKSMLHCHSYQLALSPDILRIVCYSVDQLMLFLLWTHAHRASMLYFADVFLIFFFIPALVGQTAERIFTKLSHVVDIRHHLRTY